jgi:hypothetical protein
MSVSSKENLSAVKFDSASKTATTGPDSYMAKLDQILEYRKHLSILTKRDENVFKTDIDYDARVRTAPLNRLFHPRNED